MRTPTRAGVYPPYAIFGDGAFKTTFLRVHRDGESEEWSVGWEDREYSVLKGAMELYLYRYGIWKFKDGKFRLLTKHRSRASSYYPLRGEPPKLSEIQEKLVEEVKNLQGKRLQCECGRRYLSLLPNLLKAHVGKLICNCGRKVKVE